jgi:hypothetical protein
MNILLDILECSPLGTGATMASPAMTSAGLMMIEHTIPHIYHCVHCSIVCATGSVVIDPWLQYAMATQLVLARTRPLCLADWPGSHNSAITIVNGMPQGRICIVYHHIHASVMILSC